MNPIDKLVSFFNPGAGLKRAAQREALRRYEFADKGRRGKNIKSTRTSANAALVSQHQTIVDRSRDIIRNDGFAHKGRQTFGANVVGTGINPVIKCKNKTNLERVKNTWRSWAGADVTDIDVMGFQTFAGIQALAARAIFESGEVLVRKVYRKNGVPFQLQVLECDYIDGNKTGMHEGNRVIYGVEVDKYGRPVAYWLFDEHPGELMMLPSSLVSKRVPAEDVYHIFPQWRPGQLRGVPYLATVGLRINDYKDYEDAQLIRQKVAASFVAAITSPERQTPTGTDADTGYQFEKMVPGMIEYLNPGENITFNSPPTVENYEEYSRAILRNVAAGVGLSYETLTGDLTGVNFSSGRMGWIQENRMIEEVQRLVIIPQLCTKIWKDFINFAGTVAGLFSTRDVTVAWTTPRRQFIDPLKEMNAIALQLHNGLGDFGEIARSLGYDPDDLVEQIAYWQKVFDDKGIKLGYDARFFPGVKYPEQNQNNDENSK